MRRRCWCHTHPATCPVHVMWPFFAAFPEGEQPFACFDGKEAGSLPHFAEMLCLHACHRLWIDCGMNSSGSGNQATGSSRRMIFEGVTRRTSWQLVPQTRRCAELVNGKLPAARHLTWIGPALNATQWIESDGQWSPSSQTQQTTQPCRWKGKVWEKSWKPSFAPCCPTRTDSHLLPRRSHRSPSAAQNAAFRVSLDVGLMIPGPI